MKKTIYNSAFLFLVVTLLSLTGCNGLEVAKDGVSNSQEEIDSIIDEEIPIDDDIKPEPQIAWYKLEKPSMSDSDQAVISRCQRLGVRAKQFKIKNFLIAFEGLASFSSKKTQELYKVFEENPEMEDETVPKKSGSGGFMVNYLLWPVLVQSGGSTDFMVFPETSIKTDDLGAKPDLCARAWLKGNPQGRIVITGHSYGGHAANQLADVLEQQDVELEAVVTVDPRTKRYRGDLFKTSNSKYWVNFYQKNTLFLNGYLVEGADGNINLSSTGVSHGKIPRRVEVQEALFDLLND